MHVGAPAVTARACTGVLTSPPLVRGFALCVRCADVVTASPGAHRVNVFINSNTNGDGSTWATRLVTSSATGVRYVSAGDINGDGIPVRCPVGLTALHAVGPCAVGPCAVGPWVG